MAYKKFVREAAFKIYATGVSYEETALAMRKKYPKECKKLRRQTIEKWATDPNEAWRKRLEAIKKEVQAATDSDIISDRLTTLSELRTLRESLFEQIKHKKAKSLEGGVNSLIGLQRMILEITGEHPKYKRSFNVERAIMIIFDAFSEDPKIAALLKDRQDFLMKRINEKLIEGPA